MAGRQQSSANGVENGEAPSGTSHPGELEQGGGGIGAVGNETGSEDHVHHAGGQGEVVDVSPDERGHPVPAHPVRFGQHGPGDVDPDHEPGTTDGLSQDGKGSAGTAAGVQRHAALGRRKFTHRLAIRGSVVGEALLPALGPRPEELLGRGQVARLLGTGRRGRRPYRDRMAVTIYGVIALTFMMVMYALERRHQLYVLGFAVGCVLSSAYGFLSGAWPFGVVELIWAGIALRRYDGTRFSSQ